MNNGNLKKPTHDEAVKRGRKGGKASGIIRNKNKDFKELLEHIAHQEITDTQAKKELEAMGLDADFRNYIFFKIYKDAIVNNNQKALFKLFDTFLVADLNFFNT